MKLFTKSDTAKLIRNGIASCRAIQKDGNTPDHVPVVKLFTPDARATWLLTELEVVVVDGQGKETAEPTGRAYGLCDLGMGFPEIGYVDLAELRALRGRFRLPIERDRSFRPNKPLSKYAEEARNAEHITA